jgi:NOL1/NOP2/sun family putative RNA methylase
MDEKTYRDYLSAFCDADKVLAAQERRSVRINTLKISPEKFAKISDIKLEKSPIEGGLYAESEFQLGATWEYFLGYMHTQSLSSMLPSLVLAPSEHDLVLDCAAAPGSKTSHMSMLMQNKGAILAIDESWDRIGALFSNIARLGVLNVKVNAKDSTRLGINGGFGKALVDVPCSALAQWGAYKRYNRIASLELAKTQRKMLFSAWHALSPGSELVYSTCTYEKEENEGAIALLLEKMPEAKLVPLGIEFPHEPGLTEFGKEFSKCARVYPYHFSSEGFFVAKIRKGM